MRIKPQRVSRAGDAAWPGRAGVPSPHSSAHARAACRPPPSRPLLTPCLRLQKHPELRLFCNDWCYVRYMRARCVRGGETDVHGGVSTARPLSRCARAAWTASPGARRDCPTASARLHPTRRLRSKHGAPPQRAAIAGNGTWRRPRRCCRQRCSGEPTAAAAARLPRAQVQAAACTAAARRGGWQPALRAAGSCRPALHGRAQRGPGVPCHATAPPPGRARSTHRARPPPSPAPRRLEQQPHAITWAQVEKEAASGKNFVSPFPDKEGRPVVTMRPRCACRTRTEGAGSRQGAVPAAAALWHRGAGCRAPADGRSCAAVASSWQHWPRARPRLRGSGGVAGQATCTLGCPSPHAPAARPRAPPPPPHPPLGIRTRATRRCRCSS
jgi:hypothetical protein